jgi:uncharacterized membrane protein
LSTAESGAFVLVSLGASFTPSTACATPSSTTKGGGVDFNAEGAPCYIDFAYLALTIGMTFQVSDTNLKTTNIRRTALRHALLSYAFGTLIIATTINLIAGLTK